MLGIFHWYSMKVPRGQIEANSSVLENLLLGLRYFRSFAVTIMKLAEFTEPRARNILVRSN